ncbi:SDR family NAD(P)-dependent oxidoreductase [Pseudomonas sp. dw_358]|uniref:SDR family NAD(P)-dependent oxidoreductase n=1 Tax=Pseudomonas sp. dw_358 TaxID=2720083 RepID=UPI001BD44F4D|nr:SDR family NAD(P)-dependent oxidoreductase [Pseudomonas sp. dw_358]
MQDDRVALISGANRGLGLAMAKVLYDQGWRLALGMREPALPDWADPQRVAVHAYDARQLTAAEPWVAATLARFGRVDGVIANAGIMVPHNVIDVSEDDLEAMLDINVKAPRRLAKAAWTALSASGRGRVIIIGSLSGKRVKSASAGSYSVSKFAAVALAHALRHQGWEAGIRATAVCPGFVATDMALALSSRDPALMTQAEDIGRAVALLLDLPNEASVAEFAINCQLEESY